MHSIAQNGNETKIGNKAKDLLDPNLLKSAREIYYNYCHFHRKVKRTPIGVAIDRKTHKGQLLFSKSFTS